MTLNPDRSGLTWLGVVYDIPRPKSLLSTILRSRTSGSTSDIEKTSTPDNGESPLDRRILNGLSGRVRRGEYVGILGASGAGKTTLLNALSARMEKTGRLTGEILFDGEKRDGETWKRIVGYVHQDDALLPRSTVRETIETAAKLRLPDGTFGPIDKIQRAQEAIDMLRLSDCADTRIGNDLERGVSGGERKRTSIGVELVSDVSMLFLDEPTSGLDSYAATLLINNIRQIVQERQLSCLMTIHQPSWAMFTQLDRVILLAKGGVYYDGPPRDAVTWFKGLGFVVPEGVNPADHFISIAEEADGGTDSIRNLLSSWRNRPETRTSSVDLTRVKVGAAKAKYPTPAISEFSILLIRWWREMARDKQSIVATVGQSIIILILIGFGFFRLGTSQNDVLPKIGVLFFIPINASFSVIAPLVTAFPIYRSIMKRERSSGLYRAFTAFFSKAILEVPSAVISRLPFYTVLYFMVGLRPSAGAFFIFLGINSLYLVNSVALALAIGAISPTLELSQIIAPLFNIVFLLFGGSLLPSPPPWFIWLKWISPITYIFSATIQNEFGGQAISCDEVASSTGSQAPCYQTGNAVIQAYNAGTFNIGECTGFLAGLMMAFFVSGYLALKYSTGPRFRII